MAVAAAAALVLDRLRAELLWSICGLCACWLRIDARLEDRLTPELAGTDIRVSGWVDDFPRRNAGQTTFSLRVGAPLDAGIALPRRLRLTWYDPPSGTVEPGATLDLAVRLKVPHGLLNPGGFDYEKWLFVEGYGATGYVRDGRLSAAAARSVARAWLELRAVIATRIGAAVEDPDARALLTALAIGERFTFDARHWTTLRRTGTSHLVAISGLHVGIVSALLFFLVRSLCLRGPIPVSTRSLELAAVVSFAGATIYAALAGFSVPTQRALIMLSIALLAVASRRTTSVGAGLGAALLAVVLYDPFAPLSASFWLSFIAVAVLWQLGSRVAVPRARTSSHMPRARAAIRVQWGMTVGLLPAVALSFGELSVVSPLVNLVAIPVFSLLLVPLTLLATFGLIVEPVGSMLFSCAAPIAGYGYDGLAWVAREPWAALQLHELGFGRGLLLLAGTLCALPIHALPGRYLGWVAVVTALGAPPSVLPRGGLRAIVLDVGHGLAVLIRTREHTLLYDTGARYPSGFDSGREIVLPALRSLGWTRVDTVLVSHADNDHAGGLDAVLEAYPRARVLAGPDVERAEAERCRRGQRWQWDGVGFEVLHPPEGFMPRGNDSSCVLSVRVADTQLLLMGDLERIGEASLTGSQVELRADVVVVPHHGSATSSSEALTAAVRARYAIVSAAHANQWGFPKPGVRARWEHTGAAMLVTGEVGAVDIRIATDGRVDVDTLRGGRRRPWQSNAPVSAAYSLVQ